jgi:hypothetical protein
MAYELFSLKHFPLSPYSQSGCCLLSPLFYNASGESNRITQAKNNPKTSNHRKTKKEVKRKIS